MSGLWSVKMVKARSSRMNLKCLMSEQQAHNSLSKALHLICAGDSFLEKNLSGFHVLVPASCCCRTAPKWEAEASAWRARCADVSGCCNQVASARARFTSWKHVTSLLTRPLAAKLRNHSSLCNVILTHQNLKVALPQVYLGEDATAA